MQQMTDVMRMTAILAAVAALSIQAETVEVEFYTPEIVRVVRAPSGGVVKKADIVTAKPQKVPVRIAETDEFKTWAGDALSVRLDKKSSALSPL